MNDEQAHAIASMGRRKNKYGAKATVVDGIRFDSMREANRYQELKLLERAGKIRDLRCQPIFPLYVHAVIDSDGPVRVGRYVADFAYEERGAYGDWAVVVEDAKGVKTPVYRLKKKMVEAIYGIEIREV